MEKYNEYEGPMMGDDHKENYKVITEVYTKGPWRNDAGEMNNFDYYKTGTIVGVDYYTPNNEDWGAIIAIDEHTKMAVYTSFYEMDDMEYPGSDYAFVSKGYKMVPRFEV